MTQASLEIDRLTVAYDSGTPVLESISLEVASGEFIALLGASGCGKTTLLRAVCGFAHVDRGRILVNGRNVTQAPPHKRNMAMVFQSYALWPHMTVAQNIGYGLKLRRIPRATIVETIEEVLRMLKLDGLRERQVTQFSGGQRQRVALGRAVRGQVLQ